MQAYSPALEDPALSKPHHGRRNEDFNGQRLSSAEELLQLKDEDPEQYELQIKSYAFRSCRGWER